MCNWKEITYNSVFLICWSLLVTEGGKRRQHVHLIESWYVQLYIVHICPEKQKIQRFYLLKLDKRVGSSKEISYNQFFLFMEVISWLKGLATFWNQKHTYFRTYISYQKISHVECFWQSASLNLLQMFWIHCCHVSRVLKTIPFTERYHF